MRTKLAAFLLMAISASGQVLLTPTNLRSAVEGDPAYTLSGVSGAFRITYTVESTAGVPIDIEESTTLRLYVWGADGHLVSSNAPSGAPVAPLSEGKVKYLLTLGAGTYRLQGIATPASGDTNENWNFTHHTLIVTNPPSAAAAQVSITSTSVVDLGNLTVQLEIQGDGDLAPDATDRTISPHTDGGSDLGRSDERFREVHAITARVGRLFVAGDADVGGTLSALDNSRVLRVGETNTVDLTTTSVQARSPTNDNEVATRGYVNSAAGGGESNVYRHIASYTYTGGETSVTFAFDPYCRVDLDLTGQFSPTNTAGVIPALGVQVNGHPWIYRTDMKYDANADAHPNTAHSYGNSYPGTSNFFALGYVPMRNVNVAYTRSMTAARWSFMSSSRGIHMEGRGHMSYAADFIGDYTFDSYGSLQTNDYINNNAITQMVVICMNLTNGQYLVSSQSNATFRLWGVQCE